MFTVNVCISLYLHMLQDLVCVCALHMCVSIKLKFCGCRKQVQPEGLILHIWTPLWCHCQQDAPLVSISKRGRRGGYLLPSSFVSQSLSLFQTHSHMYLQTLTVCLSHNLPLEMICSVSITLTLPRSHLSFSLLPSCSLLIYVLHKGLIHALNVCYRNVLNKSSRGVLSSVSQTTKLSVKAYSIANSHIYSHFHFLADNPKPLKLCRNKWQRKLKSSILNDAMIMDIEKFIYI